MGGVRHEGEGRLRARAAHRARTSTPRDAPPSATRRTTSSTHRYEHRRRRQDDARLLARGHGRPRLRPGRLARHGRRPHRVRKPRRSRRHRAERPTTARTKPHDYDDPTGYVSPNPPLVFDSPGAAAQGARAVAAHQPVGRRHAERHRPPGGSADVHRLAVGRRDPLCDEANVERRRRGTIPGPTPQLGAGDEGLGRRGHPEDERGRPVRPDDHRHLAGRLRPQLARRQRRQGWSKNPVTGEPYAPQVVLARRLRARDGRVLGRRAEVRDAARALEHPRQQRQRLARLRAPAVRQGRVARPPRVGRARLPGAQRRRARRGHHRLGHQAAVRRRCAPSRSFAGWEGRGSPPIRRGRRTIPRGSRSCRGSSRSSPRRAARRGSGTRTWPSSSGQIAVRDWLGEPADRVHQVSGVGWVRAVDWITYQRRTFVTPAFPGFISGHSTFSRAGAEVLASLTGSPYFPGGFAEFVAPAGTLPHRSRRAPATDGAPAVGLVLRRLGRGGAVAVVGQHPHRPDDFAGRRLGPSGGARRRRAGFPVLRRDGGCADLDDGMRGAVPGLVRRTTAEPENESDSAGGDRRRLDQGKPEKATPGHDSRPPGPVDSREPGRGSGERPVWCSVGAGGGSRRRGQC